MRVACLVVGTRGDLVPVLAFASGLARAGHHPLIATSADHRAAVETAGLEWRPLLPSYAEGIAALQGAPALTGDRTASRTGSRTRPPSGAALLRDRMIDAAKRSWATDGLAIAREAGLLVGVATSMASLADALGEATRTPVAHAHLMPLVPTRHIPPPLPPPGRRTLPGPVNLALFRAMRLLVWRACFATATGHLREALGLPRAPFAPRDPRARLLCAWSPALLPQPPDWPASRIRVTGAWQPAPPRPQTRPGTDPDPGLDPYRPDPALAAFFASGDRPIHIGFGSMNLPPPQRDRLVDAVIAGTRLSGRRAVLGGVLLADAARSNPAPADPAPAGPVMIEAGAAPYAWLFPRVAAAIHHGGSGGTHDAARLGTPQAIVPFVVDQFLWARALHANGVAPWRLDRTRLTADGFARAIDAATAPACAEEARRLADRMAPEDGVADAIAALEAWHLLN